MDLHGDQDTLDTRWRLMLVGGQVSDVLAEVNTLLPEVGALDDAFLLRWQATARNHLGEHVAAMESACKALEVNMNPTDSKTMAFIHANIGTACVGTGRHDEAVASFETAERILRELGDEWALGAVLTNHAICELSRDSIDAGPTLLDSASACSPVSEPDREEEPHRRTAIRINRSVAFFQSARTRESIDELLRARQEALQAGSGILLGNVDFNLANTYQRLHLYGSMLEAAESASRIYSQAGSTLWVRRARGLVATALARLGKRQQAQGLVDELLSAAHDETIEEVHADLASAALAFRDQGWGEIFYDPRISRYGGLPDEVCAILDRLSELLHLNYADDAYAESEVLIAQLEAVNDHPGVLLMAQFERAVRDAVLGSGGSGQAALEILQQLEEITGRGTRNLPAVVRAFAGYHAGSTVKELDAWLEMLWNTLSSWHDQHDEAYRGDFLSGRGHRELETALDLAVEADRPEVIMEVIETFRIDTSNAGSPRTDLGLAPFSQVGEARLHPSRSCDDDPELTYLARYLDEPRPVAVRGKSAIAEAASLAQQPVDLEQLRVMLAGQNAIWWSCSIFDQTLFWALMTPDGVQGGKRELPTAFAGWVQDHLRTLPMILESDLTLLGSSIGPAEGRMIALARAASAVMLDRPAIRDAAVAAIPAAWRSPVRDYCAAVGQVDLLRTYEVLAEALLPEALQRALLSTGHGGRLIVTLPPQLATLPIGLLPLDAGSVVLDHATVQFSPPAGLAARLLARPPSGTPRPHVLAIFDTVGDLPWAARRPSSPTPALTGWPSAREISEIASLQQVEHQLRRGAWAGGSQGVLSYVGHLVPGDRDHPGSAAIVCAQENAGGLPDLLTANEILSWQETCFPSHVYLGGCEGSGFGTGLEWASLAAAALARGASCILSHAWPIVDSADMAEVDQACVTVLTSARDVGETLADTQRTWMGKWRRSEPGAIPPHFWAGIQIIGRAGPFDDVME